LHFLLLRFEFYINNQSKIIVNSAIPYVMKWKTIIPMMLNFPRLCRITITIEREVSQKN